MKKYVYVVCNNDRDHKFVSLLDHEGVSVESDPLYAIKWDSLEEANTFLLLLISYLDYNLEDRLFVVKAMEL